MPDFWVNLSGYQLKEWLDPSTPAEPCRLNPKAGRTDKRIVATAGIPVMFRMEVDGIQEPDNASLGGRLFTISCIESPRPDVSPLVVELKNSLQGWLPRNGQSGHYLFCVRRPKGGAWFFHIDVVEAS
jgi:hypothetical protein